MKERFILWARSDYTYFHLILAFGIFLSWLMTSLLRPINWIVVAVLLLVAIWQVWRSIIRYSQHEVWLTSLAMLFYFLIALYVSPRIMDYYSNNNSSDTVEYINQGQQISQMVLYDSHNALNQFLFKADLSTKAFYWVAGLFSLISGGLPFGISIVCGWFGVMGSFYFIRAFRLCKTEIILVWYAPLVLFFPSIVFWLTLPLKDVVTFWGLGLMAYGLSTFLKGYSWDSLARIVLATIVCFSVRPYFGVFFSAPLICIGLFFLLQSFFRRSPYTSRNVLTLLILVFVNILWLIWAISFIGKTGVGSIESLAIYQQTAGNGGSSISSSVVSNIGYFSYFLNRLWYVFTVLFRPLPWEGSNTFTVLASLENLLLLFLSMLVLWKSQIIVKDMFRSPLLLFAAAFAILFIGAFSLQVVNLGGMVRGKINVLPFLFPFVAIALNNILPKTLYRRIFGWSEV